MNIYVGVDDTDIIGSRGTGRLARDIAKKLAKNYNVYGVTRHQLFVHPEIPFTSHNSCAVIHLKNNDNDNLKTIFKEVKKIMLNDFYEGSDPGLAVASQNQVSPSLIAFGKDAQNTILNQGKARSIARNSNILLEGLGGTEDGVIGALAGIGLASTGLDGRFLHIRNLRKLKGPQNVETLLKAGIDSIHDIEGPRVHSGLIITDEGKSVKPNLVNGKCILFVERKNQKYVAIKRN